jgi:hypothetical protein
MPPKAKRGSLKLLNHCGISAIYSSVVMKLVSFAIFTGFFPRAEPANLGLQLFLPETEREALETDQGSNAAVFSL